MDAVHGNMMRIWRRAELQINEKPACRKLRRKLVQVTSWAFLFSCPSVALNVFFWVLWMWGIMLKQECQSEIADDLLYVHSILGINPTLPLRYIHDSINWELGKRVDQMNMFIAISQAVVGDVSSTGWVPRLRPLDVSKKGKQINNSYMPTD